MQDQPLIFPICRLCKQAEESQEHTINCMLVSGDDEWLTLHEYMTPQRRVDEVRLRKVFARFKKFVDLVDDLEWTYTIYFL